MRLAHRREGSPPAAWPPPVISCCLTAGRGNLRCTLSERPTTTHACVLQPEGRLDGVSPPPRRLNGSLCRGSLRTPSHPAPPQDSSPHLPHGPIELSGRALCRGRPASHLRRSRDEDTTERHIPRGKLHLYVAASILRRLPTGYPHPVYCGCRHPHSRWATQRADGKLVRDAVRMEFATKCLRQVSNIFTG
jgi:hypothetical protein